jgi:DNA-directed RNA polymerase subunit RPC12/RpoP
LRACVFDIIYYENEDLRNKSLEERLKYLEKLKSTDHILIASQTSNLARKAEGYIVDGSKKSDIEKAVNNIKNDKNSWGIKKISEGCMFKTMSGLLSKTQNPSQGKAKFLHEIDVRVFDRKQVKGSPGVYNYFLGVDIDREYAACMLQDINARKHVVYLKDDGSYIKGKNAVEFLPEKYKPKLKKSKRWLVYIGKSDNHKGEYKTDEIIRIVSEDVFWNKNETNPDYGFPTSYINIIREPVKEKNVTDPISYLYKMSQAEPQHISIEEIERMKIEKEWQNLSSGEILNFNYIDSEEGEINGKERKTKEKNSEISTARILSISSEEKGQTEEKVNDIKEEKEVSYDGNGRKKAYEEKEKEEKKEKGKEGGSTIIIGKETWLHLKCPSCNSNLSFPSIILNREKNIHCPWCNHNFLIKREDDS